LLTTRVGARAVGATETHDVLLLQQILATTGSLPSDRKQRVLRPLTADSNAHDLARLADRDHETAWMGAGPQRGVEQFTVDLGEVVTVDGITLAQGRIEFPRAIAVDVSTDNATWAEVWQGETASKTLSAAIHDPRHITMHLPFAAQNARYVRVRQLGQSTVPWAVAEFQVFGKQ
jgi:hypothetical protein